MGKIIGRWKEQEKLDKIIEAKEPSFLAIYGRRRIGKTYLIRNYFKDKGVFFHLTGIQNAALKTQLNNFSIEFSDVFLKGTKIPKLKDWFEAFQTLRKEIEKAPQDTKVILFFDELPWFASPHSNFLQALEHLWNRYLSNLPNVILIVCGSAASWMIDHIINNKGGLHGRITDQIRLLPFSLKETEVFLREKRIDLERKQILELYMCLGGVAKYLTYLERGKSVPELIGNLCFSYNAPLISEFHQLYRSLFHQHDQHVKIVKTLAKSKAGLTLKELVEKTKLSTGGTLAARLEELKQSGFIAEIPLYGESSKHNRFLLIDEYSLFYLAWSEGVSAFDLQNRGADFWIKQRGRQNWKIWTEHAFECLCLKHVEGVKTALGIAAVQTSASKWRFFPQKGTLESGAEIDLVIDRADKCVNLCEIKFYDEQFVITKEYAEKLCHKRDCFQKNTKKQKAAFITLLSTYGAKHNEHFQASVDRELKMDALFEC